MTDPDQTQKQEIDMEPVAFILAVRRTRDDAQSALTDAPIISDQPVPRPPRLVRTRVRAAAVLVSLANRVDPMPRSA